MAVDPELMRPEISTRLVRGFVLRLEEQLGPILVQECLTDTGMTREHLVRADWVSATFTSRMGAALAQRLYGLDAPPEMDHALWQIWRNDGALSLHPDRIGPMYALLRGLGSPSVVIRRLPQLTERVNRLVKLRVDEVGRGHARVHASLPLHLSSPTAWSTHGILEALPTIWGLPRAVVERTGADGEFVFDVRYTERSWRRPAGLGALAAGLAGACVVAGVALDQPLPWTLLGVALPAAVIGALELRRMRQSQAEHLERLDRLLDDADRRAQTAYDQQRVLGRSLLASKKLSGYLPADLVERILEDPEVEGELGSQRTTAAVLFADIVGFTPRCESMEPEDVVRDLNLYFQAVDPCLIHHGGVIDKRMGDGIMVVFPPGRGDPDDGGPGARACLAGLAMLSALPPLNAHLAGLGASPLQIRVGVALGPLVQGTMGSTERLEYTVIGDTVNLAARLESNATPGHVMTVCEAIPPDGAFEASPLKTVRVKGKSEPIHVVELSPA